MSEAGETREFILSLRPSPGGTPSGTLRAVGERMGAAFEGWIGLIGLITELGFDTGGPLDDANGQPCHTHISELGG
jgi:hypothetical protein